MVERLLSDASIDAGRNFVVQLDRLGLQAESVAWLFAPSLGDWRYAIVTSAVDVVGRSKIYKGLLDALDAAQLGDALSEADLHLVSPNEMWYRFLKGTMVVSGNSVIHVKNSVFNGMKIDAVIYRFFSPPKNVDFKRMVDTFNKNARKEIERTHG